MADGDVWCRVTITTLLGESTSTWLLSGDGAPDLAAVEHLARLLLAAGRLGDDLRLCDISPRLCELLELVGLNQRATGAADRTRETHSPRREMS
jgi:hypothetical protein